MEAILECLVTILTSCVTDDAAREAGMEAVRQLPALLSTVGKSLLGKGNMGYIISNGDGTCTKYTYVRSLEEPNEISFSLKADELGIGPMVLDWQVHGKYEVGYLISITMEELEGCTLYRYEGDLEWVTAEIDRKIDLMHGAGIAHRDLHRGNIWVRGKEVLFLDWGLSRYLSARDDVLIDRERCGLTL